MLSRAERVGHGRAEPTEIILEPMRRRGMPNGVEGRPADPSTAPRWVQLGNGTSSDGDGERFARLNSPQHFTYLVAQLLLGDGVHASKVALLLPLSVIAGRRPLGRRPRWTVAQPQQLGRVVQREGRVVVPIRRARRRSAFVTATTLPLPGATTACHGEPPSAVASRVVGRFVRASHLTVVGRPAVPTRLRCRRGDRRTAAGSARGTAR